MKYFDKEKYPHVIECPKCGEVLYDAIYFSETKSVQKVNYCYHCGANLINDDNKDGE